MFGKKKSDKILGKSDIVDAEGEERITTIPGIFYGGADPEIYHALAADEKIAGEKKKSDEKEKKGEAAAKPAGKLKQLFSNKKFLYLGGGIFFLIIVGFISWYYINQAFKPRQAIVGPGPAEVAAEQPKPESIKQPSRSISTTTPILEEVEEKDLAPTTTPALEEAPLEFPRIILVDSVDLDADALTDIEEELFDTDSGEWDSDGDGYYDGQEVVNLYNPKGFAPIKLIDSGLIREYVNPTWQYRLYYPLGWEAAPVDPDAKQVLFSAITGDYVEVVASKIDAGKSFPDWFAEHAAGQRFEDLVNFSNRFQVSGLKRQDNLTAYFIKEDSVYTMIYHPGAAGFIPFRQVAIMMMQSFRTAKTSIDIPEQPVLPEPAETIIPSVEEFTETATTSLPG
ncbi:MAG: hypothetical protein WC862_05410 [Patescibacteria group bacterium]